ncbi:hypothetical protein [Methylobacterium gnaphalii]|uniref:DUF2158 domain-containing protein n=1 Tax=Methylobacterium gnaphalii TaxID=1010610 RepID=A0A512JPE8_9HYPH|nr:hypothetical protein [Methylobacterium gnaphalii]GEP11827.1 hypothetical protein MGN01_36720 [Methylobacterium gnaphalii]GJD69411.1 hypothetical protein MMMDOFMJ_2342 [Methylobacterium gnaphalii]GLS49538.1 hypothetical protein GCM10007885_23870 [Methylobacterium gnaphalii]
MVKGDKARVRPVIVEGEIIRVKFDEETGAKLVLLGWNDAGEAHERWFSEAELEPVAAAPAV